MGRGKTTKRLSRPSSSPYAQGRRAATDKSQTGESRNNNRVEKEVISVDPPTRPTASRSSPMAFSEPANLDTGNEIINMTDVNINQTQSTTINERFLDSVNSNPLQVQSIHSALGAQVSPTIKQKICHGDYVDLASLLATQKDSERRLSLGPNGEIMTKEKSTIKIFDIEKWTDAFLIYLSIYSSVHPTKFQDMLKYISTIRLGASRIRTMGWKTYDEQFRLKLANDPSGSWGNIDYELWLLYMSNVEPVTNQSTQFSTKGRSTFGKCFEYNNKGFCHISQCSYAHCCIQCNNEHPKIFCPLKNTYNPQSVTYQTFRPQFNSNRTRPANNFQNSNRNMQTRNPTQANTFQNNKYLGPRRFTN
ncbi:hypothetical protein SNE40_012069 [Patella caerulea]|uniref:C3H1-type domain-containing protein n=1 Tax=Patella caerulea TaxID=87958 RepID=A0AAN8JL15_PATCE